MKTLKMTAILALSVLTVNAQDIPSSKVPTKITANFQKSYPKAANVEWEMKKDHYEVEFDLARYDYEISYDANGKILKLEKEVNPTELPANISSAIKKAYPDYKIDKAEVTTFEGKNNYKIEIKQGWTKERELRFDHAGKLSSDVAD